jgi:hypothetical protein
VVGRTKIRILVSDKEGSQTIFSAILTNPTTDIPQYQLLGDVYRDKKSSGYISPRPHVDGNI